MKQLLNTLYVMTQGAYVNLDHETLKVEVEKQVQLQVPLHHLSAIFTMGNVMISPFLLTLLLFLKIHLMKKIKQE